MFNTNKERESPRWEACIIPGHVAAFTLEAPTCRTTDALLYLGEVEEDLDGEGDDVHAGHAPVAAADEREDDVGGAALHQPLAALGGQPGGSLCTRQRTQTRNML